MLFKIIRRLFGIVLFLSMLTIGLSVIISILFPIGYKDYMNSYGKEFNVDPFLIAAIINVESNYNKNAVSPKEAKGLMQIGPKTGEWGAEQLKINGYTSDMLFDPNINIRLGSWYINVLNKEFGNNLDIVLAAYNAGSGNVSKWLEDTKYSIDGINLTNIPFKETDDYVKKVRYNYRVYSVVYKYYMDKPDNLDSYYVDFIIYLRQFLKQLIMSRG